MNPSHSLLSKGGCFDLYSIEKPCCTKATRVSANSNLLDVTNIKRLQAKDVGVPALKFVAEGLRLQELQWSSVILCAKEGDVDVGVCASITNITRDHADNILRRGFGGAIGAPHRQLPLNKSIILQEEQMRSGREREANAQCKENVVLIIKGHTDSFLLNSFLSLQRHSHLLLIKPAVTRELIGLAAMRIFNNYFVQEPAWTGTAVIMTDAHLFKGS